MKYSFDLLKRIAHFSHPFLLFIRTIFFSVSKFIYAAVKRRIKKSIRVWRITKLPYKLYKIGMILILIWFFLYSQIADFWVNAFLMYMSLGIYGIAFTCQIYTYRKWVNYDGFKIIKPIIHTFVGILAIVLARSLVFNSLQLPPQYFDLTIGIVALFAYIPLYISLILLVLTVTYIVMAITATLLMFVHTFASTFTLPFFNFQYQINRFLRKLKSYSMKLWLHSFGAIVLTFTIALVLDQLHLLRSQIKEPIKIFAYIADFQSAGNYPGVPCNVRIRLLDNGVIAIAKRGENKIQIDITNFKEPESKSRCQ